MQPEGSKERQQSQREHRTGIAAVRTKRVQEDREAVAAQDDHEPGKGRREGDRAGEQGIPGMLQRLFMESSPPADPHKAEEPIHQVREAGKAEQHSRDNEIPRGGMIQLTGKEAKREEGQEEGGRANNPGGLSMREVDRWGRGKQQDGCGGCPGGPGKLPGQEKERDKRDEAPKGRQ